MAKAIEVQALSKQYRLGQIGTGSLTHDVNRWWHSVRGKEDPYLKIGETNDRTTKSNSEYVWSLRDINFEIEQGDSVGIIGRNGAGKSTLLKILSRVTAPTTGSVKVKGRIASLLEVGTGFHPDLSGRDNIFLNGAILGMRKAEIARKFDEMVDFAGVERYIDTPVKRYSSGMYVRLAFAVAAYLESEILIVDEVLAVGDAEFQKKCLGKMGEVSKGEGRTILFVSHNINAIKNLCSKGLLLQNGNLLISSGISNVINTYVSSIHKKHSWSGVDGDENIKIVESFIKPFHQKIDEMKMYTKDEFEVGLILEVYKEQKDVVIGFNLLSNDSSPLVRTFYNDFNEHMGLSKGRHLITFRIPPYFLANGVYKLNFDIAEPFIKKINSEAIDLEFELHSADSIGNKYYLENQPFFNSIVRPNLFNSIQKL